MKNNMATTSSKYFLSSLMVLNHELECKKYCRDYNYAYKFYMLKSTTTMFIWTPDIFRRNRLSLCGPWLIYLFLYV